MPDFDSRIANLALPAEAGHLARPNGFWNLKHPADAPAAIDARTGNQWSYGLLREYSNRIQAALPDPGRKSLGLLIAENRCECLAAYIAALSAGSALILLDATVSAAVVRGFLSTYRPDWLFSLRADTDFPEYGNGLSGEAGLFERDQPQEIEIHPDLALLLNTSGSTGSPKLIRLTLGNLASNSDSIAQYLHLTPLERPITSLPMAYSYGLSVINSHLQAGATIVFTADGVLRREFWNAVDRYGCTSFAGVPYTYQMLLQMGLLKEKGSSLRMLTQAGGKLDERYIRQMYGLAQERGWKFFVMYGQTEATARISYVPFERLGSKIGSVGIALPGGVLTLDEQTGELIYRGPNVMMGYADCSEDLAKGDESGGVIRTGDLAREDADGYFYITGRLKRFLKLFGKRFDPDHAETILSRLAGVPVACFGHDDLLVAAVEDCANVQRVGEIICQTFDLPRTAVRVVGVEKLPRTANGKLNYQLLADASQDVALSGKLWQNK